MRRYFIPTKLFSRSRSFVVPWATNKGILQFHSATVNSKQNWYYSPPTGPSSVEAVLKSFQLKSRIVLRQQLSFIMSAAAGVKLPEGIQAVKDEFLNMDLEAKRKLYKCGSNYETLEKIKNWKDYFTLEKVNPAEGCEGKYQADEGLNSKISLWQGDITVLEIDSIVNAANSSLLGGGGVDGAIHRAAGGDLLKECRELRGCPAGQAKITGGYKLPSKTVIHTVGPQGEKPDVLRSCYNNCLQLLLENQLRSIAFPCIATGIYGYPRDAAANVALSTVRDFMEKNSEKVDRIIFTVFLEEDKEVYEELLQKYFPIQ